MSTLKKMLRANRQSSSELLVSSRYDDYLARNPNILVDDAIGEFIKQELVTPQRNRRMTFSASARGDCPREQVFQFTSLKPVPRLNSDLYALFHTGTFLHLKWQALLLDAGILDDVEIPCSNDEYNMTGTVDGAGVVPDGHPLRPEHERFGWEFKTTRTQAFRWISDNGPKIDHVHQVHAYMLMTGLRVWSLIYEEKDSSQYKEFIVHRNEEIMDVVVEELKYLNEAVRVKRLPPILDECKKKQGAYKTCPFAHSCLDISDWPERRIRV